MYDLDVIELDGSSIVKEGRVRLGNVQRHGQVWRAGTKVPGMLRGNGVHEAVVHLGSGCVDGGGLDSGRTLIPQDRKSEVGVD